MTSFKTERNLTSKLTRLKADSNVDTRKHYRSLQDHVTTYFSNNPNSQPPKKRSQPVIKYITSFPKQRTGSRNAKGRERKITTLSHGIA